MEKYQGDFTDRESVAREFAEGTGSRWESFQFANDFPTDAEILCAQYETPGYEGYAFVLFERAGKLFEVTGSHCSCHGLEDQWEPEETSWAALAMRKSDDPYGTPEAIVEFAKIQVAKAA